MPGFYIFYSHQLNKSVSILLKPGFFFSGNSQFNGFDVGGFFRSNFKSNNFYLTGGLNYIGLSIYEGNNPEIESNPYFISLGVGYNINKHINVDLGYYHNLNRRIGTNYLSLDSENQQEKPLNLFNMIKLSIEFRI